jgi:hypothetical protein
MMNYANRRREQTLKHVVQWHQFLRPQILEALLTLNFARRSKADRLLEAVAVLSRRM